MDTMADNRLQSGAPERLRLGTFTPSVLLDVAREEGLLDAAALDVVEVPVPSSPAQFASLAAGELDAVFTSPDNTIAYRFLPGNPLGRLLDVEIVQAVDRGLGLALALRPGLTELHPGLRFGVDVPVSGFAFVGYALLERAGLTRDDYELLTLGSTPRRAAALIAGDCDATVLNAGNEVRADADGATLVGTVTELGPYLGTVLARVESAPGRETVDRFATALREAAAGILSGAYRERAVLAAERVLGLPRDLAERHVDVLTAPATGLIGDGTVDSAALATLVALRRRHLPDDALDDVDPTRLVRAGLLR
jgi:ABC-type nitrate/sulfonate/bicarbonate transport system substrate-binding protein